MPPLSENCQKYIKHHQIELKQAVPGEMSRKEFTFNAAPRATEAVQHLMSHEGCGNAPFLPANSKTVCCTCLERDKGLNKGRER